MLTGLKLSLENTRAAFSGVVWDPGTRPELPVLQAVAAEWGLEVDREPDHDHVEIARGYV